MIHTDIKPENVLIETNSDNAKQMDQEMTRLMEEKKTLPLSSGEPGFIISANFSAHWATVGMWGIL